MLIFNISSIFKYCYTTLSRIKMQTSKLIQLLRVFTTEEIRRFGRFIRSPYHNSNPRLEQMFKIIRPHYPSFQHPKLDKIKVFSKIFPKQNYSDVRMRKLMSAMVEKVETFLAIEMMENNRFLKKKLLTQSLGKRSAFLLFQQMTQALITELESQPIRDIDYYLKRFELNFEMYFHPLTNKRQLSNPYLNNTIDYLDYFFVMAKVRLWYEWRGRKNYLATNKTFAFAEAIQEKLEKDYQSKSPLFEFYYLIGQLFEKPPSVADLQAIRAKFSEVIPSMQIVEQKAILPFLINIANQEFVKGNQDFLLEMFAWLKFSVEHRLLIEHGRISPTYYLNVVSTGTALGKFEWIEQFIESHEQYLDEYERVLLTALAKSTVLFEKGNYEDCLSILNGLPKDVKKYEWRFRILYIKCVFELLIQDETYLVLLEARLEALRKYIGRNKLMSLDRKTAYLNFCIVVALFSGFYQTNSSKPQPTVMAARQKLEQATSLIAKTWLIKKLEQLLSKLTMNN